MESKRNLSYLLAVHGEAWAIERSRMRRYLNTLMVTDLTQEEIEQRTGPTRCGMYDCDGEPLAASGARGRKAIAVLPLAGPIVHRAGVFSAFFGGTSTEKWGRAFDQLVDDPNVGAILIDVDSPGGVVDGVPELAEKIYNARSLKRIVAVANAWMASAAYWIASAADQIVVTPSGELASIGVWAAHVDQSGALEKAGLDVTLISAGPHKVEANPFEPLSDEAREEIQTDVDYYYGLFLRDVGRHRGVTRQRVEKDFGGGRMMRPGDAVKAGVADKVATLEQTIKRLGGRLVEDAERAERDFASRCKDVDRIHRLREAEAGLGMTSLAVVPPNPPGGGGEGVEGEWSKPGLGDFTDKSWEELSSEERRRIARHYGWYASLETFSGLKLPHHFPKSGKASLAGARNALARLPQTQGIPPAEKLRVQSHLRAHLPKKKEGDAEFRKEIFDRLYALPVVEAVNVVADPMEILVDADLPDKQAPYPNHHACELRPSGEFQKGSFRTVERKHDGKPYNVNMAKPKGSDKMADQSFRYKRSLWSPSEARKHCKDHDGRFEPATGGESSSGQYEGSETIGGLGNASEDCYHQPMCEPRVPAHEMLPKGKPWKALGQEPCNDDDGNSELASGGES